MVLGHCQGEKEFFLKKTEKRQYRHQQNVHSEIETKLKIAGHHSSISLKPSKRETEMENFRSYALQEKMRTVPLSQAEIFTGQ